MSKQSELDKKHGQSGVNTQETIILGICHRKKCSKELAFRRGQSVENNHLFKSRQSRVSN